MSEPTATSSPQRDAEISVTAAAPRSPNVTYFDPVQITISVTSRSDKALLIERIELQFSGDGEPVYVSEDCNMILQPNRLLDKIVTIIPTPRYLAYTNTFKIKVYFREHAEAGVGNRQTKIHEGPPTPYLIIEPPTQVLGQVFVSFKQPEDSTLANILDAFALRAGLKAYLAENNPKPGTDLWKRIVRELRNSQQALVIWAKYTDWGEGVQRELELLKKYKIPYALLIENGVELPAGYDNAIEYIKFDRTQAHRRFETAILAARDLLLKKPKKLSGGRRRRIKSASRTKASVRRKRR